MWKNIIIGILTVLLAIFIYSTYMLLEKNKMIEKIQTDYIENEIPTVLKEMSVEYYQNIILLRQSNCSEEVLDSIWIHSEYLDLYRDTFDY